MSPYAIYSKTGKGVQEAAGRTNSLPRADRAVLSSIDGRSSVSELHQKFSRMSESAFEELIERLEKEGYVRTVAAGSAPSNSSPLSQPSRSVTTPLEEESDLDFSSLGAPSAPASRPQIDLAAKARAEREAAARAQAEARARAEAEAKARAQAEAKARADREVAARVQAEAKAKAEAQARAKAQQEAALRAAAEARAKSEAEAKARAEAEARAKAAQEAAAKSRAETDMAARLDAERKAREELERKIADLASRMTDPGALKPAPEPGRSEAEELRMRLEEKRRAREAGGTGAPVAVKPLESVADELNLDFGSGIEGEVAGPGKAPEPARSIANEAAKREAEARRQVEDRELHEQAERMRREQERAQQEAEEAARRREEERRRTEEEEKRKKFEETQALFAGLNEFASKEFEAPKSDPWGGNDQSILNPAEARRQAAPLPRTTETAPPASSSVPQGPASVEAKAPPKGLRESPIVTPAKPGAPADKSAARQRAAQGNGAERNRRREAAAVRAAPKAPQRPRIDWAKKSAKAGTALAKAGKGLWAATLVSVLAMVRAVGIVSRASLSAYRGYAERRAKARTAREAGKAARRGKASAAAQSSADALAESSAEAAEAAQPSAKDRAAERKRIAKPRAESKRGASVGVSVLVLLIAGLVVLQFAPLPTQSYEKMASDALGMPVKASSATFSLIKGPEFKFERVVLGGKLHIARVSVAPSLMSFFSGAPSASRIEFDSVSVPEDALGALFFGKAHGEVLKGARVVAHGVKLDGPVGLPPIDADILIGAQGKAVSGKLRGPDGFNATLTMTEAGLKIDASADKMALPFAPNFVVGEFTLQGTATPNGLNVTHWDGTAFDGVISGTARVAWSPVVSVAGEIKAKALDPTKIVPALIAGGRGEATGAYTMSGSNATRLTSSIDLRGRFTVHRGELRHVDLARSVQIGGRLTAGTTPFNELTGDVAYSGHGVSVRNLALHTVGALNAEGNVDIARDGSLSGRIMARLSGRNASRAALLPVAGTLAQPKLGQ